MKVISKWRQYRDESVASVCQGENAELVEQIWSFGDGRKQLVDIPFINTLREEGGDSKELSSVRAESLEHWRGQRKFDRGCKAPGVLCAKNPRSLSPPFPDNSVGIPLVVLCHSGE